MKPSFHLIKTVVILVSAIAALADEPQQTPEQIQAQKALADQMPIAGAAEGFRTPLKTFETFYSGITRLNPTEEYRCLTRKAIKDLFGHEELTQGALDEFRANDVQRDEKDFELIEFRYVANPDRPKITFAYRHNYRNRHGERITTVDRERLTFVKTTEGWRIDAVESEPTP